MEPQRPKIRTRQTLADAVMSKYEFDLDMLWRYLEQTGELPSDLPEDWDPITGEHGALEHLHHHSSMPLTSGGRRVRMPCKVCGVARVVLGCHWAWETRESRQHSLKFGRDLARVAAQLGRLRKDLRTAGERYTSANKQAFQQFISEQVAELPRYRKKNKRLREDLARLGRLRDNPELAGVWSLKKLSPIERGLKIVEHQIRLVIEDALVDMRGLIDVDVWTPAVHSKVKFVTLVQRTLREEGFAWREIAVVTEEDDSRKAIDRVRARVEGRSGRTKKKAK